MSRDFDKGILEVSFPVFGASIPRDHGYALYAALSRVLPAIHRADWLQIASISGTRAQGGLLTLKDSSRLALRAPAQKMPELLCLANNSVTLHDRGRCFMLGIGAAAIHALRPSTVLTSRLVVIKLACATQGRDLVDRKHYEAAALAQLRRENIGGRVVISDHAGDHVRDKARRVIRIKGRTVVGYEMSVVDLSDHDSMRLLSVGIGGRRKMGCGVFDAPTEPDWKRCADS